MPLTQTRTPYEFLARWDDAGALKGAHIAFIERIVDGATVLSAKVGDALPVALAGGAGFPLADALAALNVSALADGEAKATQIQQLQADHAAALEQAAQGRATAEAARDAALADVAALTAQLAAAHPPPIDGVPQSVTRRQARQALRLAGLIDRVQPAIDAIPDALQRGLMQDEWDDSQQFERQRPSLLALAGAIGLAPAQVDALFVQASKL